MAVAEKLKLCSATRKWDKMTREQRAVALAKDVISLIVAKRVLVKHLGYLQIPKLGDVREADDARKVLSSRRCTVCAKGALLVAKITARNSATMADIGLMEFQDDDEPVQVELDISSGECVTTVSDAFNESDLHNIEAAYEGQRICGGYPDYSVGFVIYTRWREKYRSPTKRLRAIMQRVIDNNGSFTIKDLESP